MTNLEYIVKTLKDNPAIIARKMIKDCFSCPKLKECNQLRKTNQENLNCICNKLLIEWLNEKHKSKKR